MAIKRKPPAHENHERWLVSYADFITLLFAFFVVMFASSQTDKAKARQISEAVEKALEGKSAGVPPLVAKILGGTVDDTGQGNAQMRGPGGAKREAKDVPPDMVTELIPSLQKLNKELEDEIKSGKLELRLEPRGLVISLRQSAFFPSGTDEMPPSMYPSMAKVAAVIGSLKNSVQIEGHTDSIPIHNARFASNWELSAARAIAVLNLFTGKYDLPETRFAVVGRADTVPVDTNDTDEGRMRNRRVDIVIVDMLALKAVGVNPPAAAAPTATPSPQPKH